VVLGVVDFLSLRVKRGFEGVVRIRQLGQFKSHDAGVLK
jgi:hypothetical protein